MEWLMLVMAVSLLPFTNSANVSEVCSAIANPHCSCADSAASVNVRCTFEASEPLSPLFANSSFASSVTLDTLDISENNLASLPDNFFANETINTLILRNNSFAEVPAVLTQVKTLKRLDLSFNNLTSLSVDVLGSVKGLQKLDLSNNQLTTLESVDPEDKPVGQLKDLLELNLARNALRRIGSYAFSSMTGLTTLNLTHNRLAEVTKDTFSQLQESLVTLDLSHNGLRYVGSQAFQSLQEIRTLHLAYNDLNIVIGSLHFPQHLTSLDLRGCGLTSVSHCSFYRLTDLGLLDLRGNPLNCTCELFFLHQWYQGQGADIQAQWTCLKGTGPGPDNSPTVTASTSGQASGGGGQGNRVQTAVADLRDHCQDAYTLCPSTLYMINQIESTLDVDLSGDTLDISWTLVIKNDLNIDGIRLEYIPEDKDSITSDIMLADQRSLSVNTEGLVKHFMVCLDVLMYTSAIVHQNCRSFQDETGSMVVGILAGVVFLAPCLFALAYVVFKDTRITKALYRRIDSEEDIEKQEPGKPKPPPVSEADGRNPRVDLQADLPSSSKSGEVNVTDVVGVPSITVTDHDEADVHGTSEVISDGESSAKKYTPDLPDNDDVRMVSADTSSPAQIEGIQNLGFTCQDHHPGDEACSEPEYESTNL